MLLPLFQNNLLTVAPAYTGHVDLVINVASVYQKGTDYQYVGSAAIVSSVQATIAISFSWNGDIDLVISGHAASSINYVFNGAIALQSGVQAKTFITPTYRGQIDLIISLQSVPVAS